MKLASGIKMVSRLKYPGPSLLHAQPFSTVWGLGPRNRVKQPLASVSSSTVLCRDNTSAQRHAYDASAGSAEIETLDAIQQVQRRPCLFLETRQRALYGTVSVDSD